MGPSEEVLARLWGARSVFGQGSPPMRPAHERLPLALVAASSTAGADVGPATQRLPARPILGLKGAGELRIPVVLDAVPVGSGSPKGWLAVARGCAAAGTALQITPRQLREHLDVLRASGVPLVLELPPGEPAAGDLASASSLLLVALGSRSGAPAVLDEEAVPGLVEAARGISSYKAAVGLLLPPGRAPGSAALRQAAEAGARALALWEGNPPLKIPPSALIGFAASLPATQPPLAPFLVTDEVTDGVELAVALAGGSGLVSTSLPVSLAMREQAVADRDWKAVGDQLAAALRVLWQDAAHTAGLAGCRDPRELARGNLRALTYDAAALSGLKLAGYEDRLPWWTH